MQNFKQYLQESNTVDGLLYLFNVKAYHNGKSDSAQKYELKPLFEVAISKISNIVLNELVFTTSEKYTDISINISLTDDTYCKNEKAFVAFLQSIVVPLREKIKELGYPSLHFGQNANFFITKELPSFKIVTDRPVIILASSSLSLHNIHKVLDCSKLEIGSETNITDSVLGILMIRRLDKQKFSIPYNSTWSKIIDMALLQDIDILDCQEQLIDAGFGKFAKL